jgi:hypothetical protein
VKKLSRDVARFLDLDRAEQRTLLVAATCLPLFWVCLRLGGLARMQALLQRPPVRRSDQAPLQEVQALGRLVNLAARRSFGPVTCLTRSLLLIWLLRRRGVQGLLCIGVRLGEGDLVAHAWVEFEGMPINDEADIGSRFLPFANLGQLRWNTRE